MAVMCLSIQQVTPSHLTVVQKWSKVCVLL